MSIASMLKEVGLTKESVRRIAERNGRYVRGLDEVPGGVEEDSESEMEEGRDLERVINENREPYLTDVAVAEDLRYQGCWGY